jgi:hypothetical protein
MGMKDISNKLKILSNKEADKVMKNYNCTIFSQLDDDHVLVKYSSKISNNITKLFKEQLAENPNIFKDSGLSRQRNVISAVHIAAAIASYSRMSINKFKNIPDNPCIMSDTDSVVLPHKLNDKLVAQAQEMKLEYKIKRGIFIRKKLYTLKTENNQIIIKASGVKGKKLTFEDYEKLLIGRRWLRLRPGSASPSQKILIYLY